MAGEKCIKVFRDVVSSDNGKKGVVCKETHRDAVVNNNGTVTQNLYACPIVTFDKESKTIELRNCGFKTKTTKGRLNKTLKELGVDKTIKQRGGIWYVNGEKFSEGMKIKLEKRP